MTEIEYVIITHQCWKRPTNVPRKLAHSDEVRRDAVMAYLAGYSQQSIARKYRTSQATISHWVTQTIEAASVVYDKNIEEELYHV